jgi:hypothetical protein
MNRIKKRLKKIASNKEEINKKIKNGANVEVNISAPADEPNLIRTGPYLPFRMVNDAYYDGNDFIFKVNQETYNTVEEYADAIGGKPGEDLPYENYPKVWKNNKFRLKNANVEDLTDGPDNAIIASGNIDDLEPVN